MIAVTPLLKRLSCIKMVDYHIYHYYFTNLTPAKRQVYLENLSIKKIPVFLQYFSQKGD